MGKAWKQTVTTYFSLDVVNQVMHLLDARVARVAEQLGVEYRNLRSALAPSLENYYDYMHYTPAGAARLGREVPAALLAPPSPPGPPVPRAAGGLPSSAPRPAPTPEKRREREGGEGPQRPAPPP